MTRPLTPALTRLAHAHGVGTEYWNWHGAACQVSAETVVAVLAALGVDVDPDSEESIGRALAEHELAPWRRTLPPTVVGREGWTPWVAVHVPDGSGVRLRIELEDGSTRDAHQVDRWVAPREVDGHRVGEATFELPGDLPAGWHRLIADTESGPLHAGTDQASLIITPQRLTLPPAVAHGRVSGLMAQIYQVRSADSWGIGDLADLASLARWAGEELHAGFVLINPIHAAEPSGHMEPSPYLPTTRRFANPVYLRVEDVPEMQHLDAEASVAVAELAERARALNASDRIERDAAWTLKREALEIIHEAAPVDERQAGLTAYLQREGEGLRDFATWCAIADRHGTNAEDWPDGLEDPVGDAVAVFRARNASLIEFHVWLQWQLERQLSAVQEVARAAGMPLGIVHDLAVGVHPLGADAWGLGDALARGVTVGAPPDQFNQLGQDWSQPPWRPDRLAELGYAPFRDMVRTVLRDSGGLRADHIIGLFRLWWIPDGHTPDAGAYVHYDHEALLGILVLEAQRAGAVVVGEDLGVVPPHARDYLIERGLLGTSILWFEWEGDAPKPPEHYRELCLSSVTTHDLPPTAGYLGLTHVEVREALGLLTRSVAQERAAELASIDKVRRVLVERGLLYSGVDLDSPGGVEEMTVALHRLLSATPSRLLAVAVADLVGDRRAVNQPGTNDEYPNWRVPLSGPDGQAVSLAQVMASPLAARLMASIRGG